MRHKNKMIRTDCQCVCTNYTQIITCYLSRCGLSGLIGSPVMSGSKGIQVVLRSAISGTIGADDGPTYKAQPQLVLGAHIQAIMGWSEQAAIL